MARRRKIITLTLTRSCNLRCGYCFEANKSGQRMTFETAKRILDEALCDDRFGEYEIDFFGGEPFLEFDLIQKTIRYVAETYPKKLLLFTATTNGTLVHGEIQAWLKEHADIFVCALSLDGTKRMHDLNRCDSFDKIDVEFFAKTWPKQEMKMTVSEKTLPYLAEGVIFMHEHGYAFTANLAFDIDWSAPENESLLERELKKLIDYYLAHPEIKPCTFLDVPLFMVASTDLDSKFRQCGAGIEMFSYDVDGRSYACQFFMPLSIGAERSEEAQKLVFPEEIDRTCFEGECRDCMAVHICHTCYGSNFASTGNIFKKDPNWCKLQKITFRANAYFRFKQLENGSFRCEEGDRPYWLKGIKMILSDLH